MAGRSAVDPDWDRSNEDAAAAMGDPCRPLEEEIEVLEDQVAVLEEGLPGAPGAQRAALAKEINQNREELDARRSALRLCRSARR
jgi:hypothetical protein